jgi:hypothetical protein
LWKYTDAGLFNRYTHEIIRLSQKVVNAIYIEKRI